MMEDYHKKFILRLADDVMILGQRLSQWCGHGPVLEQDIALTNIALDLIGEARNYYQYIGETEGKSEDHYPMLRDVREYQNILLVELPNGNWGDTIMRQFMFDCYHYPMLEGLTKSEDQRLSAIAQKSIKEAKYHKAFSSEWVKRLGDGTEESHEKMQDALLNLIPYFDEAFTPVGYEEECIEKKLCPDLMEIKKLSYSHFTSVIEEATLVIPKDYFSKQGGKTGLHTEHLGYILAEMQYLQRVHPGATW
jgi:ring-1,2-phenylacetyl-CoA epoxidase subunit PaaC